MSTNIIVTTGVYDAIKEHLRRKQVTIKEENRLLSELKTAKQVLRKNLPEDIVTVNKTVTIKDHADNQEYEYNFVATNREKVKKNKHSILSDMALATVGYKVGDVIDWPFREGDRKIEILNVQPYLA